MKPFILLLMLAVLVSCSSLPKEVKPRSLDFARMKMKTAREAQDQRDYKRAVILYRDAYDYYTRIDNIEGKIQSALSLARQYFYLDRGEEKDRWLKRASELITNNLPELTGAKAILEVEMAFSSGDYRKILDIASGVQTQNPEWQMELLCMTMVSHARLKQDYAPVFSRVLSLLPLLEKSLRKGKIEDAGVLSQAYYYIGYIYSGEGRWREAADYFERAKRLDGRIDNTYGLGNDLYALARCYEKLGLDNRAKDTYRRAQEIFELLEKIKRK